MDTKFERSHHEHSIEEPELEFLKGFGIQTKVQGLSVNGVPCILDSRWLMRSNDDDLEDILRAIPTDRPLLVYSQFFRYGWLRAYKKEIKTEWLNIDQTELPFIQASSACVHMRFGDLTRANMNLGEQYYHKAIQLLDSDEISIVTDDPGHPIVKSVARKYGAKIIKHQRWIEDFYFMLAHKRIATAESTFSWWAAWLSEAERIIAPGSNIDRAIYGGNRYWANMKSTPFVDDEPRYIYI
ncbi:hypothetical protein ACFL1S_01885 [Pseudomonadota bacterium]